jgi:hypothetical protein
MPRVSAFAETSALYALMCGGRADAGRVIAEMLPGERAEFANLLTDLLGVLGKPCSSCGKLTPANESYIPIFPASGAKRGYLCNDCGTAAVGGERAREVIAVKRSDQYVSPLTVRCVFRRCTHSVEVTGPEYAWKVARASGWGLAYPERPASTDLRCPFRHDERGRALLDYEEGLA